MAALAASPPRSSAKIVRAVFRCRSRRHALSVAFIGTTALLILASAPGEAHAETAPSYASDSLKIGISGYITPKCELVRSDAATRSFGDIMDMRTGQAQPKTLDLEFHLTCNSPYEATLTSKNGGLAFEGTSVRGFSTLVTYSATVDLDARAGDLALNCDSTDMRGGRGTDTPSSRGVRCAARSRSHGVSDGDGKVHLTLDRSSQPLLRGTYSDELILRVSPRC
jgi:hypothetical protein